MVTETRDRQYANKLADWWGNQDPNCFYYVTDRRSSYYAPREDIEALGLPSELDWEALWPEYWPDI